MGVTTPIGPENPPAATDATDATDTRRCDAYRPTDAPSIEKSREAASKKESYLSKNDKYYLFFEIIIVYLHIGK